jgi:hypothetical protein
VIIAGKIRDKITMISLGAITGRMEPRTLKLKRKHK